MNLFTSAARQDDQNGPEWAAIAEAWNTSPFVTFGPDSIERMAFVYKWKLAHPGGLS